MLTKKLNCAVIGLGGMGERHARKILQQNNAELKYIVDFDEIKTNHFIVNNNLKDTIPSSLQDVISDTKIDLISLASFDDHHYEQVMQALKNNKHVFVEKPLCQTRQELENIHQIWCGSKQGLVSNLVLRTAPLYIFIKELIQNGKLGEIYAFDADYLYGRLPKITDGWRQEVKNYSIMQGGGIHMIDLMLWLTGQKPSLASSLSNKIITRDTAFKYHDFHSTHFSFESGLVGRITANFGCMHHHQHVVRIFGSKGTFIHDDMGPRIHWSREEDSKPEMLSQAPKPEKKAELINDLLSAISSHKTIELAQQEFDLMAIVLATDESLHTNSPKDIRYLQC